MKKNIFLSVIGLAVFAVLVLPVSAQKPESVGKSAEKPVQVQATQTNPNANKGRVNAPVNDATGTTTQPTTEKNVKGQTTAESHRSVVANAVQNLLAVADREGGIGQQVKVIAEQQNDTKDRAADLIYAVENRSKVKTFFIGTSYKNLGELRSQMVQTRNQIDQLKRLADKAENDQDKADLQTQIQTLEQDAQKINTFITDNENQFSLFGWAVKLFR